MQVMGPKHQLCVKFHRAVELIGGRWTGAIIQLLMPGRMRFAELRGAIPDISDRMLSERLRELGGIAQYRTRHPEVLLCLIAHMLFAPAPERGSDGLGRAPQPVPQKMSVHILGRGDAGVSESSADVLDGHRRNGVERQARERVT